MNPYKYLKKCTYVLGHLFVIGTIFLILLCRKNTDRFCQQQALAEKHQPRYSENCAIPGPILLNIENNFKQNYNREIYSIDLRKISKATLYKFVTDPIRDQPSLYLCTTIQKITNFVSSIDTLIDSSVLSFMRRGNLSTNDYHLNRIIPSNNLQQSLSPVIDPKESIMTIESLINSVKQNLMTLNDIYVVDYKKFLQVSQLLKKLELDFKLIMNHIEELIKKQLIVKTKRMTENITPTLNLSNKLKIFQQEEANRIIRYLNYYIDSEIPNC